MVSWTWSADFSGLDACRAIDSKLRLLARALNSWRAASVGSIRLQLVAARVVIYGLDRAQESWQLSPEEIQWRRELKGNTIGLASLERTMARQRARTRHLREGDAGTKYFHLMACHRRRKNFLFAIQHDGQTFSEEHAKSEVVFSYYNGILGAPFLRHRRINLALLDLPRLDLSVLAEPFSDAEIARVVRESPADRAPGPDGFTGALFKATWAVVGPDVLHVFRAVWELDLTSLNHINGAIMVVLHKIAAPSGLRDYRPINLVHSIGKWFTKCCYERRMEYEVKRNQSQRRHTI
jgi:hypothetical protein